MKFPLCEIEQRERGTCPIICQYGLRCIGGAGTLSKYTASALARARGTVFSGCKNQVLLQAVLGHADAVVGTQI